MIPIENVPDEAFARKMLGDGVGFVFDGDTLYAPCNGKVIMTGRTGHAVGIRMKNKVEILLHVGQGAIFIKSGGFEMLTAKGRKVEAHEPLIRINRKYLEEQGMNLTTSLVITGQQGFGISKAEPGDVDINTVVMELFKE